MKYFFVIFLLVYCASPSFAQKTTSYLSVEKTFFQEVYELNGQVITERQVLQVTSLYPEAQKLIKKSRRNDLLAMILVGIGGSGLITGVAAGASEDKFYVGPFLLSATVFGGGILLKSSSIKRANEGVDTYNYASKISYRRSPEVRFGLLLDKGKIGLSLIF